MIIPESFELHDRSSPMTRPRKPIFAKVTAGRVVLGIEVRTEHTNSRGLVHGGLIAALADNKMGRSLGRTLTAEERPTGRGATTTSLSIDYRDRAEIGEWLELTTGFIHAGRRSAVTEALVMAGDRVVARSNAHFQFG